MQMMLVAQCQQDHEKHAVDDRHRHQEQGGCEGSERAAASGLIEIHRADQQDDRPRAQTQDGLGDVQVDGKQRFAKLPMLTSWIEDYRSPPGLQIYGEPDDREHSQSRCQPGETWEEYSLGVDDMRPS